MSDDVRADAREVLAQWAKYGVAGTSDVEEVAPALVDRLLAELDQVTGHLNAELVMRDEAEDATRHYEIQRDAALATLQQVREWAEQRRHDSPSTDDLATVLLDGAAHQLFRILDGGVSNV